MASRFAFIKSLIVLFEIFSVGHAGEEGANDHHLRGADQVELSFRMLSPEDNAELCALCFKHDCDEETNDPFCGAHQEKCDAVDCSAHDAKNKEKYCKRCHDLNRCAMSFSPQCSRCSKLDCPKRLSSCDDCHNYHCFNSGKRENWCILHDCVAVCRQRDHTSRGACKRFKGKELKDCEACKKCMDNGCFELGGSAAGSQCKECNRDCSILHSG